MKLAQLRTMGSSPQSVDFCFSPFGESYGLHTAPSTRQGRPYHGEATEGVSTEQMRLGDVTTSASPSLRLSLLRRAKWLL